MISFIKMLRPKEERSLYTLTEYLKSLSPIEQALFSYRGGNRDT